MSLGASRLAKNLRVELAGDPNQEDSFRWGQVTAINTGLSTVDVRIEGSAAVTSGLRYLGSYVPSVGDAVLLGHMQGQAQSAWWVIGALNPAGAGNPYYFSVYRAASWTSPAGGGSPGFMGSIVPYDTIDEDPNNNFVTGAGAHYAVPLAGEYDFRGRTSIAGGTGGQDPERMYVSLWTSSDSGGTWTERKRGSDISRGNVVSGSIVSSFYGCEVGARLKLNQGDWVALVVWMFVGTPIEPGSYTAWFQGNAATVLATSSIPPSGSGSGAVNSVSGSGPGIAVSPTTGFVVVQNTGVTSLNGQTGAVLAKWAPDAYNLLTDPNPSFPDLIMANGDVIWVETA